MSILNKIIVSTLPLVPKKIVGYFASRYIAGESLADGVRVTKELNQKGITATMDVLGEGVTSKEESIDMRKQCEEVLHAIHQNKLDATLSLKPTQMGLSIDKTFCLGNIKFLCELARQYNTSVCIDMEDHPYTDATLEIYQTLRKEFSNVTTVIQAYLRRSEKDIAMLLSDATNLRLCKGIYVEPESIAFKDREQVRTNYKNLLRMLVDKHASVSIATHDEPLIIYAYDVIKEYDLKKDAYEFQMLLGVREERRDQIVRDGHHLRVYVPFGKQWYAYSTRRLKENPKMAGYIVKSILGFKGTK